MLKYLSVFFFVLTLHFALLTHPSFARTTPEDIVNQQRQVYESRVKNYSDENKQKLESLSRKIELVNKSVTGDWEENCLRQGLILEEYIRRNEIEEAKTTDGKSRNLSNEIENARYWLTYAHEAVAYQAGKNYIYNLTSEKNIKSDATSSINQLNSDLNILKGKVLKSQQIIEKLVTSE